MSTFPLHAGAVLWGRPKTLLALRASLAETMKGTWKTQHSPATPDPPLSPQGYGVWIIRDLSLLLGKRLEQKRVAWPSCPPTYLFTPTVSPQYCTSTGLTVSGASPLPCRAALSSDKKLPYSLLSYKQRIKLGLMNVTFPDFWDSDTMRICKDFSFLWPSEYSVWVNIYIWIHEIKDLGEQRLQQRNNK